MSSTSTVDSRRRPKGDKRQRTREALIRATMEMIREKGFERTTLADVAERAGMTTGAIYGNFKNRDELFMAVANIAGAPIVPDIRPGMTFAEQMAALADAVIAAIPQRRSAVQGALAFHGYTLTHEEVRAQVLERTRALYEGFARAWLDLVPREQLPMAPDLLIRVLHALIDGLLLQRHLTPELITDEVIRAAFAAFARQGELGSALRVSPGTSARPP